MDEDDLKMYEQFLAANGKQQQLEEEVVQESEAEIDLDNIDYDQLDP